MPASRSPDIRLHPDHLAMVAAENPHALAKLIDEIAIEFGRPFIGEGARLRHLYEQKKWREVMTVAIDRASEQLNVRLAGIADRVIQRKQLSQKEIRERMRYENPDCEW